MDFLNKHYEKVILLAVMLVFFIGMIFVIGELNNTKNITSDSLKIKKREADQSAITEEEKKRDYNIAADWKKGSFSWAKSSVRNAKSNALWYSDLVQFTPVSECPFCLKLIPLTAFNATPCPNPDCGKLLQKPPARPKYRRNVITADDSDGDGMPNAFETKYGLNPANPRDAQYDADGDGFTNCYEQMMNTDPTNPRSKPPLNL